MRLILFILLLNITLCCNAQKKNDIQFIKDRCFEGYIFPDNMESLPLEKAYDRYTPVKEDIVKAERVLREQIKMLNSGLPNQYHGCPVIHKNLDKYKRQYFGIIDSTGNKIIWINFVWSKDKDLIEKLNKEVIFILDGCSYHWRVKVNLKEEKLFDLSVNGVA